MHRDGVNCLGAPLKRPATILPLAALAAHRVRARDSRSYIQLSSLLETLWEF